MTEWVTRKKASLLGMASGLVAGLVAVTPAAGFAGPTDVGMSRLVKRFKPGSCNSFRRFVKLPNAFAVFPGRFSLPNGRRGRAGDWTVWLVPVDVSPQGPPLPARSGREALH